MAGSLASLVAQVGPQADASSHQRQTEQRLQRQPGEVEQRPHVGPVQFHEGVLQRREEETECERTEGRPARRQASCHSLRSGGHSLWGQRFPLPFKKHVLRRCECARPHGETAVNGTDEKFLPHGGRSFSRAEWDEQQTKYKCIIRWIRAWYTRRGNIKQQRLSETWEDVRFFAHVAIHKNSKKPMTEPSLLY